MRKNLIFLLKLSLPLALMLLIFILSSETHAASSGRSAGIATALNLPEWFIRKSAHALLFGLLGLSWYNLFRNNANLTPGFKIFLATALTAAYALTDEFHQTLTPERAGLLSDVLIDTTAGLIGSILCALTSWVLYTPKTKSRKRKELKALWRKNQVHLDRIKAKLSPKKT